MCYAQHFKKLKLGKQKVEMHLRFEISNFNIFLWFD